VGSTRRRFTDEYKAEAVQYVISSGQPVAEVARSLGIVKSPPPRDYGCHGGAACAVSSGAVGGA
jgi:hypothetical protein